jgi:ribitol-5-phosphate 2-dehydrogenase (NADP+) / D-ribitol-5-phosphate cytidylyltransferase
LRTVAVVLAEGAWEQDGAAVPLALARLAGKTLIEHSVAAIDAAPSIEEILVVTTARLTGPLAGILDARGHGHACRVIEGGRTRPQSVWRALQALGESADGVLVHDAARPLISPHTIKRCVQALGTHPAVCTAVPAADTIVAVRDGLVTDRPPRDRLRRRQTPQAFALTVIRKAYELARADLAFAAADECGVVLRYLPEVPVRVIPGSERSIEITGPGSLAVAEALLASPER